MPFRTFDVPGVGHVKVYKRRGSRAIKLTVTTRGQVRVTMPLWVPYKVGVQFAASKADWLQTKRHTPPVLSHGARLGKAHHLIFIQEAGRTTVTTRNQGQEVRVHVPADAQLDSPAVQHAVERAAKRALKQEAEQLLPQRVHELAKVHGFTVRSVSVKHLTGRWGSCTQHQDITLNSYLMQLDWQYIDYVILHELVHTRIMAHGPAFWNELGKYVPHLAEVRKHMRSQQPVLKDGNY